MEPSNEHAILDLSYLMYGPRFLDLACYTPFTAALASAMAEGDSSDDRGPAGSGKARGTTLKYDSSDIKLGCRSIQSFRMAKNS